MLEFIRSQDLKTIIRLSDVHLIEIEPKLSGTCMDRLSKAFSHQPVDIAWYEIVFYIYDTDESEELYTMATYQKEEEATSALSKMLGACNNNILNSLFSSVTSTFTFPKDLTLIEGEACE